MAFSKGRLGSESSETHCVLLSRQPLGSQHTNPPSFCSPQESTHQPREPVRDDLAQVRVACPSAIDLTPRYEVVPTGDLMLVALALLAISPSHAAPASTTNTNTAARATVTGTVAAGVTPAMVAAGGTPMTLLTFTYKNVNWTLACKGAGKTYACRVTAGSQVGSIKSATADVITFKLIGDEADVRPNPSQINWALCQNEVVD